MLKWSKRVGWYTANQPLFFAPIYMWNRLMQVEHLVVMVEAQYSSVHQRRCKLFGANGSFTASLPVKGLSKSKHCPLNEMHVSNPQKWADKFRKKLQNTYGKCSGYEEVSDKLWLVLEALLDRGDKATLSDYGYWLFVWGCQILDIACKIQKSDDVLKTKPVDTTDWVVELGIAVNCTNYLGGQVANRMYLREEVFERAGMRTHYQTWKMPDYETLDGKMNADPWTSILDPLLLHGVEWTKYFLQGEHVQGEV